MSHSTLVRILLLCMLPLLLSASKGSSRKCVRAGEQIHLATMRATVTDDLLKACYEVAIEVPPNCLREEFLINRSGKMVGVGSITHLFGRLCQKSQSQSGVDYFVKLRLRNWNSADEEFSLSLERVFVSKPERMLKLVKEQPDTIRKQLLNDIVWGFLSNRVYGPVDPFEGHGARRTFAPGERVPQEVLNRRNYHNIFLKLHDNMPAILERYPKEMQYMLTEIRVYLETWGVEY